MHVFQTAEHVNIVEGLFDISLSDVSLLPHEYSIALQRYIAMSFVTSVTFLHLLYYRNRTRSTLKTLLYVGICSPLLSTCWTTESSKACADRPAKLWVQ